MSIQTNIHFLNANDPAFRMAAYGTPQQREDWEDENGPMADRPGARIETNESNYYRETDDEYGGWVIDLKNLPPETTHIVVSRS